MDVVRSVRTRLENVTALVTELAGRQELVEDEFVMVVVREMDKLLPQWCEKLEQACGMPEEGDLEEPLRPDVPVVSSKQTKRTNKDTATGRRSSRKKKAVVEARPPRKMTARDPEEEENNRVVVAKRARGKASKIRDGMAGRTETGDLVYFALSNKIPTAGNARKRKATSLWSCPAFGVDHMVADRSSLEQLQFSSLVQLERVWYLQQLEADLVRRFRVNAPVLFENAGADMLTARQFLLEGTGVDESTNVVIDGLRLRQARHNVANIVSSKLSAVNNTVLMVAAKMHSQLADGERFLERAEELASVCTLKADTIARYRSVGELMLRSPVVACMLPGFVAPLLEPITCLLGDDGAVERLEAACMDQNQLLQLPAPPSVEDRNLVTVVGDAPRLRKRDAPRKCRKCGEDVIQYGCSVDGCFIRTCWKCVGYESDPLERTYWYPGGGEGEWLKVYMFCPKHCLNSPPILTHEYELYVKRVEESQVMTIQEFLVHSQVSEAAAIVDLFSRPRPPFTIVPQPGDGWCTFRCVATALEMELHTLIRQLKSAVDAYLEDENVCGGFDEESADEFKQLWEQLDPEDAETVQVLWSSNCGDYSLPMMAWFLNRDNPRAVQIRFWGIRDSKLQPSTQTYPDAGDVEFERHIDILKSNPVMPHYDLLKAREPEAASLDRDGFIVHTKAVAVDAFTRDYLYSLPVELFHAIFNNAPANDEENDGKRLQLDFATVEASSVTAQQFMIELKNRLRELVPNFRVAGAAVFRSEEGCLAQLPHLDYPPPTLVCLVALVDGTSIDVWPAAIGYELNASGRRFERENVVLNAGDVLLFRGDLVHAGASSAIVNVRVHCYLEPVDGSFQRQWAPDGTYFMHECDAIVS